jgi:hypothetical protein
MLPDILVFYRPEVGQQLVPHLALCCLPTLFARFQAMGAAIK